MKRVLALLGLILLALQPAFAQTSADDSRYSKWMTFYYVEKNTDEVPGFFQWLQSGQLLERRRNLEGPVVGFVSTLILQNPDKARDWLNSTEFTGYTLSLMQRAAWLATRNDLLPELSPEIPEFGHRTARRIADTPVTTAAHLDIMWASFFASGDPVYVLNIISALETLSDPAKTSAEWSLGSNMKQHPAVKQIVVAEASRQTGPLKQKLDELIARMP